MKHANGVLVATVLVTGSLAHAQPAPGEPPDPGGDTAAGATTPQPAPPPGPSTATTPGTPGTPGRGNAPPPATDPVFGGQVEAPVDPYAPRPASAARRRRINFPEVLTTPTGWLLPAGVLYSKNAVDTGGGVTSDQRVGLGDVAEFGVATIDRVRERNMPTDESSRIQPYVTASFRMGVAENRLFAHQPGVTLGFRKSFERNHEGFKSRIAELALVASKHLGPRAALHIGASLWDASLQSNATPEPGESPPPEITLHGGARRDQIRVFGGLEAQPLPRSSILIDLGWSPEFCYQCADADKITLRPELSWGVRYEVASFAYLESGVRVPDIGNFNLLDAQIFGQVTLTSLALKNAVDRLK